ncbi:MAG: RDD family protein [Acidobacteriaceae bacterium]
MRNARVLEMHGRSVNEAPEAGTRVMAKFVPDDVPAWKTELTEKLAASRARRSVRGTNQARLPLEHRPIDAEDSGRANVAAAVAARYAGRPSYREVLEREAEEAALAAEKALIEAQAAQEAVRHRLEDARLAEAAAAEAREAEERLRVEQERMERESVEVRYELDERTQRQMQAYEARRSAQPSPSHRASPPQIPQFCDPLEEETVTPAIPLAANLIEFPRELVAARKARPRLAEGPLRDAEPQTGQLRIFEVEPEMIDHRPGIAPAAAGLDWSSIRLDTPVSERAARSARTAAEEIPMIRPAALEDRIMAALVDAALSFAGFLIFVFVFSSCTAHPPAGRTALGAGFVALIATFAAYQWLFFRFGESTPGMSYARIALCTLDDDNPTRQAMQRRVGALLLSALPLGLGLLWAAFDEDQLGWHDRISGTYQRSYK